MEDELFTMREEKVSKALIKMGLPAISASLVTIAFNIIDTYFVSLLKDPAMIAATTIGLPLTMIIQSFGEGLAVGSGAYISKLLGQKNETDARKAFMTSVVLTAIIGFLCSFIFLVFLNKILPFFKITQDVILYSRDYLFIILLGSLPIIAKTVFTYLLRCQGIIKWPMICIFIGIFTNLLLDPILMFGFNLKIKGAALATTLAEYLSMALMAAKLFRKNNLLYGSCEKLAIDKQALQNIVSIGFPAFVRNILSSISMSFLVRAAGVFSTAFVAAIGIAKKSLRIITAVYSGYSHGIQPFTAYNYGARRADRIKKALRLSQLFVLGSGVLVSFIFFFYGKSFLKLFCSDPEINAYAAKMLKGYALSIPVLGIYHIYATSLQALGENRKSFVFSLARQGFFYIPVVTILPKLINETGIYLTQPLSDWLTLMLLIYLCKDLNTKIRSLEEKTC